MHHPAIIMNNVTQPHHSIHTIRLFRRAFTFLAIAFGLLASAQTYAVDYTVNTVSHSGGLQLTVTNISDTSDTLEVSGTGSDVTFAAAGRTFSLNGAAAVTGSLTTAIPTTANNNSYITLNTQGGDDVVNLGTIAGVLPSIFIDGGLGADTLNVTGTLAQTSETTSDVRVTAETVNFGPSSSWSEPNGSLNVSTDNLEIDTSATVTLGGGFNLSVQSALRELVLGAEVAGTLSLTDAELDRVISASLATVDTKVRVKGDITRAVATSIQIQGGELIFDGGTLYSGGTYFQLLDCSIRCPFPGVAFGDGFSLNLLNFVPDESTLSLAISGATYPQYERLDTLVAPTFDGFLHELILTKLGSYTPMAGDAFTIVNNLSASPVNGNFSDLEEGAKMANFLGSGLEAQITYTGGDGNDVVITVLAPQPEIAVEQPAGTNLSSGTSTVAFGDSLLGAVAQKTFTVKNTGDAPLTLGAISITGANAGDFTVTTPPASPVAAISGSTTFTVSFRPGATGARSATLSLPNNDTTGSEAPFLISLTGNGTGSAIVASFASPGYVTGGWEQNEVFTIGTVGTTNPGNNWPTNESPDKATDGNVDTKFLIFRSDFSGLLLRPANNAIAYNRLALTTANDAPERDPQAYFIYGLATAPSSTSGTNIPFSGRTELARGILNLPEARKTGPSVVQFDNTTAYPAYLLVFEDVRSNTNNNLTQIAEVKLSQGMTVPNQVSMGKVKGGRLSAGNWIPGSIRQPGDPDNNNWPAAESPNHALDGDTSTKYLHIQGPNAALGVEPEEGAAVINSVSFWTANDSEERDPASYAVYGMNSIISPFFGASQDSWVLLGSGSLSLPATRNAGPIAVNFTNTTSYQYYAVVFPSVKNATNLTQISEVAFAYHPPTPPAGTDKSFAVLADSTTTLTTADWGFSDTDTPPNAFSAVKITSLPTSGTLRVNGAPATVGQIVSVQSGQAGQIWTARDSNRSWRSITSSADGTKLAAVAHTGRIYTSTDSGANWTPRDSDRNWWSITSSADGTKLAAVGLGGKIYTSTDSGATWIARDSSRNWYSITSSADGAKLAAVVYNGQIYTSTDSGVTWIPRDSNRSWYSITSSADGTKLAAVEDAGDIYTSTDSGATWTARNSLRYWQSVTSSADGTKLAAVVNGGQIYTSTDSGATWTARDTSRNWYSITSSADGTKLAAVVYNGQIYTSTDSGANWTARDSLRNWHSITSSADGTKLAAVELSGKIYTSDALSPSITYTAASGSGSTSFTFQVQDDAVSGNLDLSPNTLTFNRTVPNAAPTFSGYVVSTPKNTVANIGIAKILTRAADADGGTLAITAVSTVSAQGGSVSLVQGKVRFTPAFNATGLDTFTVTISDGQGGSVVGTVTVTIANGEGLNQAKLTLLPGGNVALLFMGVPGQQYVIERSTDLQNWSSQSSVTAASDGTIPYIDTNPPPGGSAFYRTSVPQN